MNTILSSRGQLVLPAEMRRRDGLRAGQRFNVERVDQGEYRLLLQAPRANEGLVDWLLACPEKGFFASVGSEDTDSLCGTL